MSFGFDCCCDCCDCLIYLLQLNTPVTIFGALFNPGSYFLDLQPGLFTTPPPILTGVPGGVYCAWRSGVIAGFSYILLLHDQARTKWYLVFIAGANNKSYSVSFYNCPGPYIFNINSLSNIVSCVAG